MYIFCLSNYSEVNTKVTISLNIKAQNLKKTYSNIKTNQIEKKGKDIIKYLDTN